jgi:hypothetical protein
MAVPLGFGDCCSGGCNSLQYSSLQDFPHVAVPSLVEQGAGPPLGGQAEREVLWPRGSGRFIEEER